MSALAGHAPAIYVGAVAAGLLGSAHCLGMCGGLVSAFFMRLQARGAAPYLIYHFARITVYAVIGFLAALLGAVLISSGRFGLAQGALQIVAGIVIIGLGLDLIGRLPFRNRLSFAPVAWLRRQFGEAGRHGPLAGAGIGGAINALMPCSLTMAMAFQASASPTPVHGMALMLAFGFGTLPSMLAASWLFGRLGIGARSWLLKAAALTIVLMGAATLWQGIRYYLVMARLVL